ncbi:MAG: hypothetical protein OES37_06820, partial [Chromatiales bacterium]|nr:hypothetical protein [Chromatiales bacterium]
DRHTGRLGLRRRTKQYWLKTTVPVMPSPVTSGVQNTTKKSAYAPQDDPCLTRAGDDTYADGTHEHGHDGSQIHYQRCLEERCLRKGEQHSVAYLGHGVYDRGTHETQPVPKESAHESTTTPATFSAAPTAGLGITAHPCLPARYPHDGSGLDDH